MTKEQLYAKWTFNKDVKSDLEAVIATEIAKAQEQPQPEEPKGNCTTFDMSRLVDQVQPALNPIEQAYERGEKIRQKNWNKREFIKKYKYDDLLTIDENSVLMSPIKFNFATHPEKWELYTEPVQGIPQPEEPKGNCTTFDMSRLVDQPQPKPFDRDRFEAMFRAVVASEPHYTYKDCMIETEKLLTQLDSYYATKEGGANG